MVKKVVGSEMLIPGKPPESIVLVNACIAIDYI